jgi:phage terminase|nr:MAG TPA: Large Terminase [Caudoviricetes sp.]
MDRTTEYAKLVVKGKKIAGRKEYLACERHLQDLKKKNFDYKFNKELAEKAINIINELVIGEGEEQQKLSTRGFQNFIIGSLFGWVKKKTKERRFREAYIQVGRQNGKSILSGAMANQFATFSGYKLGRIFCAATKQEQANIVWDEIAKFIRSDNDLQEMYKITEHERTIKSFVTGNVIKSLGRDTKSADGFRSILAICDELHAHPNNQMYKLMLDGQINVDGALTLAITTAGFNLNGFCFEQYKFCEKVLEKVIDKESLFIFICEMDKDDDIWDYNNWAKSNPYLLFNSDNTINKDMVARLAEKAVEAKEKGGADLLNFMTKHLNYWVTNGVGGFVDLQKFKECESDLSIEDMKSKECYLGIDLSSGGDLTSISLVFPLEHEKIYIYSHSFMPELRLAEHEKTDDVPYRMWVNKGLLTLTSGAFGVKTDYKFIINHLKELIEKYEIRILEVGYDSHNASVFLQDLDFLACDLTEIKQSAKSLNDATKDFQLSVKANQLLYDKENDLLKWSIANATTTSNSFGEIKIDKQAQKYRIDPVDAVIDAWKIMLVNKNEYSADSEFDDWFEMIKGK